MSIEEGSVECGGGVCVCMRVFSPLYCRIGELPGRIITDCANTYWRLHLSHPCHTRTCTRLHKFHTHKHTHTLTNIHHYCICEHTFYPCPPKMFISKSCRCSLIATVADTHVLNILIAYFLMFVYRIATCRSEITHIYSLTLHLV